MLSIQFSVFNSEISTAITSSYRFDGSEDIQYCEKTEYLLCVQFQAHAEVGADVGDCKFEAESLETGFSVKASGGGSGVAPEDGGSILAGVGDTGMQEQASQAGALGLGRGCHAAQLIGGLTGTFGHLDAKERGNGKQLLAAKGARHPPATQRTGTRKSAALRETRAGRLPDESRPRDRAR